MKHIKTSLEGKPRHLVPHATAVKRRSLCMAQGRTRPGSQIYCDICATVQALWRHRRLALCATFALSAMTQWCNFCSAVPVLHSHVKDFFSCASLQRKRKLRVKCSTKEFQGRGLRDSAVKSSVASDVGNPTASMLAAAGGRH